MSDFKIESNIPIPEPNNKYPLAKLEVGDSFSIPCTPAESKATRNRLSQNIATRRPKKFATRTVPEGVRVWRIA